MRNRILLVASLCLFAFNSFSQQLTFQGKIFTNNTPVDGNHSFQFLINDPPINWTETHPSIPVNNGLYAVVLGSINALPLNLFDATTTSRQLIVRYDGNPIDTVTIYSPFERDYTVPANIKDGISWGEISGIPTIDNSNTNEIQTLNLNNDTLRISQANYVVLPQGGSGNSGDLLVNGNFTVIDTAISTMISIPPAGMNASTSQPNQGIWQSFKATSNGRLRQIVLNLAVSTGNSVIVKIYNGQGNSTQAIGQKTITGINSTFPTTRLIDLSTGITPVILSNGNVYTFEIIGATGGSFITVSAANTNPYADGRASLGTLFDLSFYLNNDNSSPSNITINQNGFIGMGTDNPTAQLEVNGRIKDKTGFVMPVGTIMSYGGRTAPEGWLLCDGSNVDRIQFADLFAAIDTSWGNGNGTTSFNLPDLRGQFLRGVDGTSGNDPDKLSRTAPNIGGNTGNNVGSVQTDAVQTHRHAVGHNGAVNGGYLIDWSSGSNVQGSSGFANHTSGLPISATNGGSVFLSSETRPKNAYVNYIIKY